MAEPLKIRFATDLDGAKKGIADLTATVVSNMLKVGTALKSANDNVGKLNAVMSALPATMRTAAIGFLAFEGLKLAVDATAKAAEALNAKLDDINKVSAGAQRAGVGTTFFQQLLGDAKALGLETDQITAALNKAREAGQTRLGENGKEAASPIEDRLRQHLAAGNINNSQLGMVIGAPDQEDRIRAMVALVQQLLSEGKQLAAIDLTEKFFGADVVRQMQNGVDVLGRIKASLDEVRSVGADGNPIYSPEQLAAAERVKQTIDETSHILSDAMAPIQRDLLDYQLQQAQAQADFNKAITEGVSAALRLYGVFTSIGEVLTNLGNSPFWDRLYDGMKAVGLGGMNGVVDLTDADRAKLKQPATATPLPTITADKSRSLPAAAPRGGGGSSANETDAIERYVSSLQKANETAKAELDTVGKSNVEKAKAVALAKLNAAARDAERQPTEQEIADVNRLAEATQRSKDALKDHQQAAQQAAEAMRTFGQQGVDALADMIFEGKSAEEVLSNLAKTMAKQALNGLLMGTGPFAGLFGTAASASSGSNAVGGLLGMLAKTFGGAHAGGGDVDSGKWGIVGEKGPELIGPSSTRRTVIPNGAFGAPHVSVAVSAPAVPSMAAPKAAPLNVTVNEAPGVKTTVAQDKNGGLTIDQATRHLETSMGKRYAERRGALFRAGGGTGNYGVGTRG